MPSFTFCGCVPADFPETRDEHAVIVGRVNPGDEREFAAPFGEAPPQDAQERAWWFPAPTADWFPSDGPLPKRLPDPEPDDEDAAEKPPAVPAVSVPARPPVPRPAASVTPPAPAADGD